MIDETKAKEMISYSFLVMFANDSTINAGELRFLEKLALEDQRVDDEERAVLRNIFARVDDAGLTDEVREEIRQFRSKYDI